MLGRSSDRLLYLVVRRREWRIDCSNSVARFHPSNAPPTEVSDAKGRGRERPLTLSGLLPAGSCGRGRADWPQNFEVPVSAAVCSITAIRSWGDVMNSTSRLKLAPKNSVA